MTVENGQEGDGGGVKLSCRCYQVKPPTAGCRHGDTVVTTRCSTRKEQDLAYMKGLPLCVWSSLFLPLSLCQVLFVLMVYVYNSQQLFQQITHQHSVNPYFLISILSLDIKLSPVKLQMISVLHTHVVVFLFLSLYMTACVCIRCVLRPRVIINA